MMLVLAAASLRNAAAEIVRFFQLIDFTGDDMGRDDRFRGADDAVDGHVGEKAVRLL